MGLLLGINELKRSESKVQTKKIKYECSVGFITLGNRLVVKIWVRDLDATLKNVTYCGRK